MVLYLLKGVTMPLEFGLRTGLNTVGRNPTNDFCIHEASVSSFHAEVTVLEDGRGVIVRDLQSTNGTFIDGQPVEEVELLRGHALQFGSVELRLELREIEIKVPALTELASAQPSGVAAVLDDGQVACSRDPHLPATHEATEGCQAVIKCPGVFNAASMRAVKLSGGKAGVLFFCPDCNAKCRPIPGNQDSNQKKKSLFSRLTQTIHLGWKK
jgi:pSer/pThr/pTyr-binding forkhead associated (FHA) protein